MLCSVIKRGSTRFATFLKRPRYWVTLSFGLTAAFRSCATPCFMRPNCRRASGSRSLYSLSMAEMSVRMASDSSPKACPSYGGGGAPAGGGWAAKCARYALLCCARTLLPSLRSQSWKVDAPSGSMPAEPRNTLARAIGDTPGLLASWINTQFSTRTRALRGSVMPSHGGENGFTEKLRWAIATGGATGKGGGGGCAGAGGRGGGGGGGGARTGVRRGSADGGDGGDASGEDAGRSGAAA